MYGLNSADAVFKETRDRFYIGARRWLNETLRQASMARGEEGERGRGGAMGGGELSCMCLGV